MTKPGKQNKDIKEMTNKEIKAMIANAKEINPLCDTLPWTVQHKSDHSDIEAYIAESDEWETIATITSSTNFTHIELSDFLIRAVNQYQPMRDVLREARTAFEIAFEEGWHFTAEQSAEKAVERIKEVL